MKKIINTKNLIYLTIFGAPLYLIRFELFKIPTNVLEILIGVTFIFWIIEKNIIEIKKIKIRSLNIQVILSILSILLGILISALLNENYKVSFGIFKGWFIFPIIFGLIVYNKINTSTGMNKLLNSIFLSSFLVSAISLFYYFLENLTFDGRLTAFYLSPNHLAMFLAPGFLIGSINILDKERIGKNKLFLLFGTLIILSSIYLTSSYASWIAIFLALIFSIIILNKTNFININFRISFLIFFFIFISFLFFQQNNSKFQNLINMNERSSSVSRIMIWKVSSEILSDNLIFGIGAGNFQEKYLEYQKHFSLYLDWAVPQPHNLYLAFWLQGGLLGILGFIWLIYFWIKKTFKFIWYSKNRQQKKPAIILLAIIIYFLIHGLVDTPYWKNDLSLIFWIIIFLGLLTFYKNLSKHPASPRQRLFR